MLVLVVGPSGAGKDTLLDRARAELSGSPGFRFVRRTITRPAQAGGEDHEAITRTAFEARRDAGGFALWWEAHGLLYGLPADILQDFEQRRISVANVSRAMIADAAARFAVHVVEITAPPEVLAARLAARGRESAADVAGRLARQVALPPEVPVTTIMNDGTAEQGAARLLAVLLSLAAQPVRPERNPSPVRSG